MADARRQRLRDFNFRKQIEQDYNVECEKHLIPTLDKLLIALGTFLTDAKVRELVEALVNFIVRQNIDIAFQVVEEDLTYCKIMEQQLAETVEHLVGVQKEYFKEISALRNKWQQLDRKASGFALNEKYNSDTELGVEEMHEAWMQLPDFEKHKAAFLDPRDEWANRLRPAYDFPLTSDGDNFSFDALAASADANGGNRLPYDVDALPWFFDVNGGHLGKKIQELCALLVAHRVKEIRARDQEEELKRRRKLAEQERLMDGAELAGEDPMSDENLRKEAETRAEALASSLLEKNEEIEALRRQLEEQAERIEVLGFENSELREQLQRSRLSANLEDELEALQRQLGVSEAENMELKGERERLLEDLERLRGQLGEAEKKIAEETGKDDAANAELLASRKRSLLRNDQLQALQAELDAAKLSLADKDQLIRQLSQDNSTKQTLIDELLARLALLDSMGDNLASNNDDPNVSGLLDHLGLKTMVRQHVKSDAGRGQGSRLRSVFERLYRDAFEKQERLTDLQSRFREMQLTELLTILHAYKENEGSENLHPTSGGTSNRAGAYRTPTAIVPAAIGDGGPLAGGLLKQVSLSPIKAPMGFKFILAPIHEMATTSGTSMSKSLYSTSRAAAQEQQLSALIGGGSSTTYSTATDAGTGAGELQQQPMKFGKSWSRVPKDHSDAFAFGGSSSSNANLSGDEKDKDYRERDQARGGKSGGGGSNNCNSKAIYETRPRTTPDDARKLLQIAPSKKNLSTRATGAANTTSVYQSSTGTVGWRAGLDDSNRYRTAVEAEQKHDGHGEGFGATTRQLQSPPPAKSSRGILTQVQCGGVAELFPTGAVKFHQNDEPLDGLEPPKDRTDT
eukprot:g6456.t1